MDEVGVPIALERQPQGQRHHAEQAVDRARTGRMAVHDFVLKRAVQGEQQRVRGADDPERPAAVLISELQTSEP